MKLSYLLINIVLVAGGIFVYDQIKSPDPAGTTGGGYDPLQADAPYDPEPAPEGAGSMTSGGMRGSSDKATIRALEDRLASLERLISRRTPPSSDGTPAPVGGKLPELAATDFIDPENPSFDEKTVQTIEAYVDEINRRKAIARQRERVGAELDRLGVELSDEQKKNVVDATLTYQDKARELLRQGWSRDEKGREARKEAFSSLQDEYATTINRLVPTSAAEKISSSRVARGMGFYNRGGRARADRSNRSGPRSGGR